MASNKDIGLIKTNKLANYLALVTSTGTIFCCALPALMVSLGAGAALSSLISLFPQLIILSIYKIPIFIGTFIILFISGLLQQYSHKLPCPADKDLAVACLKTRKTSLIIYLTSVVIFIIGFLFAFLIPFFITRMN